jgi:filamentous hemagglutinin family protein
MSSMTKYWRRCYGRFLPLKSWLMGGAICFAMSQTFAFKTKSAVAQIPTPDTTLPNNSIVEREGNTFNITGGTQAGSNLFHSFGEFSVPTSGTAFFNNALDIQNIISRVTGGSVSNIDGLIRTQGNANLFLINPNGIIFGKNANLNIGGSFVATTANAIGFGAQGFFSASDPNTPALLTINPSAFFFNQIAAAIQNNSVAAAGTAPTGEPTFGLRVPDGRSLLLLGGNVNMDGGRIRAFDGQVELGGLATLGTVRLLEYGNNLSLGFPDNVTRADVSLTNGASVRVSAAGGGSITVNARNLDISGGSSVSAGIGEKLGTANSQVGDIRLNAKEAIRVRQSSRVINAVDFNATGNSGNLILTTGSLLVTDGSQLSVSSFGQGNAGNIIIDARDTVSFDGVSSNGRLFSAAFSSVEENGIGQGGDIRITTGSLSVTNGAALVASTRGQGNAGNVIINARNTVSFDGIRSSAFSTVEENSIGKGGDIRITTGSLSVTNGAGLLVNTDGQGNAGNVIIDARDTVSFNGGHAFSTVEENSIGKGGDIRITTGLLSVINGAQLQTATLGQGDAGNVIINARDFVSFDEGYAYSSVDQTGIGKGGDIRISTGSLFVTNGAQLVAATGGQGGAGNVTIDARDTVSLQGVGDDGFSSLISTSNFRKAGNAGRITVSTGSFRLADGAIVDARTESSKPGGSVTINANTFEATNGGQVTTTTFSSGQAGNITLNVTGSVTLSGSDPTYADRVTQFGGVVGNVGAESGLFASTNPEATGKGGNIVVNSSKFTVQDGAKIAVNSQATGVGGNIEIQADNLTLKNQALISAETASSQGGNIEIGLKDILVLRQGSRISTNAGTQGAGGDGGNITINAPNGFIVAVPRENSDITANAYTGKGGNVTINAFGIFGTQFQEELTPKSDITASSQFGVNGTVEINTPDINPSQGLINLPTEPVDSKVASGCQTDTSQNQSRFVVTGRGGLPPNPREAFNSDTVRVDWVTLNRGSENRRNQTVTEPTIPTPAPIVEATGLAINAKGEVLLTAEAPTATPHSSWQTPTTCSALKSKE